jgi:copper transport protein
VTTGTWELGFLAGVLALLGILALAYAWRVRRSSLAWVGVFTLATAALFVHQALRLSRLPERNPYPPTAESLRTGQRLYRAHCAVCHGSEGRGDGPAAASLVPRPADLRRTRRMTDALLFTRITQGLPGTAMPAFRDTLTDEERWHVVNYLRALTERP